MGDESQNSAAKFAFKTTSMKEKLGQTKKMDWPPIILFMIAEGRRWQAFTTENW